MQFILLLAGVVVVALLSWGSIKSMVQERALTVLETASGQVLTIKERADALTKPVQEKVEELDRRVDSVQQGIEKLHEGADLVREGISAE